VSEGDLPGEAGMSDWAQIDALKRKVNEDEARVAKETRLDVDEVAGMMMNLLLYTTHNEWCVCLTPAARARFVLTKKCECTCGRNQAMEGAMKWVSKHAPALYVQCTGITPGDA
jgi:hypothetical protein